MHQRLKRIEQLCVERWHLVQRPYAEVSTYPLRLGLFLKRVYFDMLNSMGKVLPAAGTTSNQLENHYSQSDTRKYEKIFSLLSHTFKETQQWKK